MGSTRLEIKLGPCYFESRNRYRGHAPRAGRGARGAGAVWMKSGYGGGAVWMKSGNEEWICGVVLERKNKDIARLRGRSSA